MNYYHSFKHRNETHSRFIRAIKAVKPKLRNIDNKRRKKNLEVEVAYIIGQINAYGFNFFPEKYTVPFIEQLENITTKK